MAVKWAAGMTQATASAVFFWSPIRFYAVPFLFIVALAPARASFPATDYFGVICDCANDAEVVCNSLAWICPGFRGYRNIDDDCLVRMVQPEREAI